MLSVSIVLAWLDMKNMFWIPTKNRMPKIKLRRLKIQSGFENKVGQIRSGGPSGGFRKDFLRSGVP